MNQRIYRFEVPIDDQWHPITACSTPLHISGMRDPARVEFWAWHRPDLPARYFRVFGTGHPIPDGTDYRGTTMSPGRHLVWHLMERR